ncbi:hypothetical protein PC39_09650 [Salinisphaera sp. PC39]|uniref:FAD assembly factor SdhE n=1 Tax=Salinisphaera sp. PC39 TaxID=1304156 RepID=UPI003342681B
MTGSVDEPRTSAASPVDARVRWLCRRGMKELDVLLERFLAAEYVGLDADARADLLTLLEQEDPILWAWVLGRDTPGEPRLAALVRRIREYRRPA